MCFQYKDNILEDITDLDDSPFTATEKLHFLLICLFIIGIYLHIFIFIFSAFTGKKQAINLGSDFSLFGEADIQRPKSFNEKISFSLSFDSNEQKTGGDGYPMQLFNLIDEKNDAYDPKAQDCATVWLQPIQCSCPENAKPGNTAHSDEQPR